MSLDEEQRTEVQVEGEEQGAEVQVEVKEIRRTQGRSDSVGNLMEGIEGPAPTYNAIEVNADIFDELILPSQVIVEMQDCWRVLVDGAESHDAVGEAIYAALFDSAPSLQSLFQTPRAVMAMRFMNGLSTIIRCAGDPRALKITVETLGFKHLEFEVTIPRAVIFRNAIVDLMALEVGARLTPKAHEGILVLLNYVGGAFIFVRTKFSERLKILSSSWALATNRGEEVDDEMEGEDEDEQVKDEGTRSETAEAEAKTTLMQSPRQNLHKKMNKSGRWNMFKRRTTHSNMNLSGSSAAEGTAETSSVENRMLPSTFQPMFVFNAAVMGFGNRGWMTEVVASWDTIVRNVSNSYRLQEECDILSLRLAKYKGTIALPEYKSVMLASLRSLVKNWNSQHEVAWTWLWDNVERMIKELLGKPAAQEKTLSAFLKGLDQESLGIIRREVFAKFFTLAPSGQDYFKQSTTRLHFITDKLVTLTLEMYKEPKRMVHDLSALGLRHVGYGIPTDMFGPFVTACVQVVRMLTVNKEAEESFRWSLSLISRILMRVIGEGSTIVMKAINQNSSKQMQRAIACAPRGKRANWVLSIQVGTQAISPLLWAVEIGSFETANVIIQDLLTIRADRDRYYYGMDIMFSVHPDIVRRLCLNAVGLVPTLLDGLVWRSGKTENGSRRVNYYLKHLLVDEHGAFSKTLEWIVDNNDAKLVCHPLVAMVTDMVWHKVAFRTFFYGRTWFILTIVVFISSQSVLNRLEKTNNGHGSTELRIAIFMCRIFVYIFSMGQWMNYHAKNLIRDMKVGALVKIGLLKVPEYLCHWHGGSSLVLTTFLLTMLTLEPMIQCIADDSGHVFTEHCVNGDKVLPTYSIMSTLAMLAYFALLLDLSVFSTRVSAYCLVCGRLISEVGLFLFGLGFVVVTFACSISALDQDNDEFANVTQVALQLSKIAFGIFSGHSFDKLKQEPILLAGVFMYVVVTVIFLGNLLIAQLNCSYQSTYIDMLGFARLKRGRIVNDTMPSVPAWRWTQFIDLLQLNKCLEFGEGDIGLAGGIQLTEPASLNASTVDMIKRFGGSTSPLAQWPVEDNLGDDADDRFERIEKLIDKAMKRITSNGKRLKTSGGFETHSASSDQTEACDVHDTDSTE